jgi:hypothetical protein
METQYKVINGTSYNQNTPQILIDVLEKCRLNKTRIVFDYGDTDTGISWGDVNDISGYIGRTTGENKVPILVYNSRSLGGGCILTDNILTIRESKGKKLIYSYK